MTKYVKNLAQERSKFDQAHKETFESKTEIERLKEF